MGRTILVIDDDDGVRRYFARLLESLGYSVRQEQTGNAGLRAALESTVDLVIADLQLPGTPNGMDLVRALRAQRPECPVVVVSGHPTADRLQLAEELGVEFLTKPFEMTFIRKVLDACFTKEKGGRPPAAQP